MNNFKRMGAVAALGVVLAGLGHSHAQEQIAEIQIAEEIPAPPPLNLPLIAPERVPEGGNFYSAAHDWPPLPFNPLATNLNVPVYSLGAAMGKKASAPFYLFDDRAVVAAEELALAAAEADPKAKGLSRTEPPEPPSAARGVVPTGTDLLLDIEDATNGVISLKIYNPDSMTNNPMWDVWAATQFSGNPDNWTWIARTEPGQTNLLVSMLSETQGYLRLGATNNDVNSDGIPDYWMSQHFGHVTARASDHTLATNDFDGDGISNIDEFLAGTDPNSISFAAHIGYGQTATRNPTGTITVLGGVPSYFAVMVDGTKFNNPSWQHFTTNPVVPLPDADGEHLVWVALRGRMNPTEWQGFGVTLDRTAPPLVITGPTNGTTSKPIIQVTGYSTDAVWSVSCTLSNALGVQTNLSALATTQDFGAMTTNHFQVFDVELTTNANNLTLQVSDLAGNVSTTNFNITFDTAGDSNAPVLTVLWPQNNSRLGSEVFTLRARVDDETASVSASIVSPGGTTNEYGGTVERNGAVWVEDIAVEAGTNLLTLTATDAAGNKSATNLTLIRSSVSVTIQEPGNLNDPFVTVSGTVSDGSYSVWVNGIQATVSGTDWTANNVPVPAGGSATVSASAIPPGGSSTTGSSGDPTQNNPSDPNASQASTQPEKPAEVKLAHGEWERHQTFEPGGGGGGGGEIAPPIPARLDFKWRWDEHSGGYAERVATFAGGFMTGLRYWVNPTGEEQYEVWADNPGNVISTNAVDLETTFWSGFAVQGPQAVGRWTRRWTMNSATYSDDWRAKVNMLLRTGGIGSLLRECVTRMTASAQEKLADGWREIAPQQIAVPGFGNLNTNGTVDKPKPDNITSTVTPQTPAAYAAFEESAGKYRLEIHGWGGSTDIVGKTTKIIVGQPIQLTAVLISKDGTTPPALTNVMWKVPGTYFVDYVTTANIGVLFTNLVKTNSSVLFYWSDGGLKKVACEVKGVAATPSPAEASFSVVRPNPTVNVIALTNGVKVDTNWAANPGSPSLYLGVNNGHVFFAWISDHDTTGVYDWLQTGKIRARLKSISDGKWIKAEGYGLDNAFPYPFYAVRHSVDDSPGIGLPSGDSNAERSDEFQSYVMFKPPGIDSQYVPLQIIEWKWSGAASNTITNGWVLDGGSTHTASPTPVPAFNHPLWTNNLNIILTNFVEEP